MTAGTRRFGPRGCALAELTDQELQHEVEARRQRRKLGELAGKTPREAGSAPPPRQVRQWLANLELDEAATLADVEAAFVRLSARYEPAARDDDEKRRSAAQLLLRALRAAYDGTRMYLTKRAARARECP